MIRILILSCLLLVGCLPPSNTEYVKTNSINTETRFRLEQWHALISLSSQWSDTERLTAVNNFINRLDFVDDIEHWQKEDYWASPLETLVTRGGDCEDLAIAKYFTLKAMGIEEDKLRLTYAKTATMNKAHLVVSYFEANNADPLVLDNLTAEIQKASQRQDLLPVYSFNDDGVWLEKRHKSHKYIANSSRLTLWRELIKKMDVEAADETNSVCLYQYYDLENPVAKTYCS
jgi:predicted transglutaminase-like cysteine proteinase